MYSRGRAGARGGRRGGSFARGGRGGHSAPLGPPAQVIEAGTVIHDCEEQLLIKSTLNGKVPYFNGRIFLENKQEIGKVDEILGPVNDYSFSVTLGEGFKAKSFKPSTVVYIDPQQTLPVSRFTAKPPANAHEAAKKKSVIKDKSFKRPAPGRGGRGGSFGLGRGNSMSYRGLSRGRGGGFRGRG